MLYTDSKLTKAVVNRGILARCHSVVGRNVMFLTRHFDWSLDDFVFFRLPLLNADFMARYLSTVLSEELRSVYFATELLCLREHSWQLSNTSMSLSVEEIDDFVYCILLLAAHIFLHQFTFCIL